MMDVLFVPFNAIKLFVCDHDIGRQDIGSIPQGLTKTVVLRFSIIKVCDSFCVDEIISVDTFDDSVLHGSFPFLFMKHFIDFFTLTCVFVILSVRE